jgi:hypothetical protein
MRAVTDELASEKKALISSHKTGVGGCVELVCVGQLKWIKIWYKHSSCDTFYENIRCELLLTSHQVGEKEVRKRS